jgi:DNA-binding response OmpR family regulator
VHDPVLIVEDDPDLRSVITFALEQEGLEVEAAPSGMVALYRAAGRQPSIVLLDLGLPDMLGDAVANGLRRICGDDLPIIVVSAMDPTVAQARGVRADGYLHKPFEMDDLIATVRRLLRSGPG